MNERAGFEFSQEVKWIARRRARGVCQDPLGCSNPNNGRVDHLTSVKIGRLIGMDRKVIRSLANAQMLCDGCDKLKQIQERMIWQQLESYTANPPGQDLQIPPIETR